MKLQVSNRVSQGDTEVCVPLRVFRVGEDTCPGDGGSGDADGDVRVTCDDFPVVFDFLVALGAAGRRGSASFAGEAAAEMLGEYVHVGQASSFDNRQV